MNQALRQQLRQQRRMLSPHQQKSHAQHLARHLGHHPRFLRSQHIACYLANDGELDLKPLINKLWGMGKSCYLPVLQAHRQALWFCPYTPDSVMQKNHFGILEPQNRTAMRPPWALDMVLMPLVGFDAMGNRLGMGGGFYDRSFAYLQRNTYYQQPTLVGVAHQLQQVGTLQGNFWDVPMRLFATEKGVFDCT
ncbi:5-formyltetrahydrofolate cyclo-ligase [Candidatus Venteria ishoeyi]|nr:5-formyltetrahydrofolate cyclo-ligase [Candidatus Venteria ishoeyi]MDM8545040.1 5-formyltetrahydrofolate cyclo-ligase [Candidatus Venteria ishoeyi]